MKRVAVLQSNYIPWKGYFDIINDVDTFVFYDDVQYTTNDWRNRNRIKTVSGAQWLTIPVGKHMHRRIDEVELPADGEWAAAHWRKLEAAYQSAPYFERYRQYFRMFYLDRRWTHLSAFNQALIVGISRDLLGITTAFERSSSYQASGAKSDRLLDLVKQVGATEYVSGPSARDYLDEASFASTGITTVWKDYAGYPEYPQAHGEFRHDVSILDLLFHTGPAAAHHIWGWRHREEVAA